MPPKAPPCGNPLWAGWVQDLANECKEKGSKSEHAYAKAAKALKSCPIVYQHPEQAIELAGIGPSIVSYLVTKLEKQCREAGTEMPQRVASSSRPSKASAAAAKKKRGPAEDDEADNDARREARRLKTQNGGIEVDHTTLIRSNSTAEGPAKKAPAKRAYVPKERSGAYAILLGLYTKTEFDDRTQWTLKAELIRLATPFSGTPFDVTTASAGGGAQAGGGWHTAWSASKILIEKALVLKDNKSPAHYALSEEGWQLADKLARTAGIKVQEPPNETERERRPPPSLLSSSPVASLRDQPAAGASGARPTYDLLSDDEEDDMVIDPPLSRAQPGQSPSAAQRRRTADLAAARLSASHSPRPAAPPSRTLDPLTSSPAAPLPAPSPVPVPVPAPEALVIPFGYHYLNELDERVTERTDAEQGQEEGTLKATYRIEYRQEQEGHKMAGALIGREMFSLKTRQGYMRARVAASVCPGFTSLDAVRESSSPEVARPPERRRVVGPAKVAPPAASTAREKVVDDGKSRSPPIRTATPLPPAPAPAPPARRPSSFARDKTPLVISFDPLSHAPSSSQDHATRPMINRHPLDPVTDHVAPPGWTPPPFEAEIWPPGSYSISLVIDTRESGLRKSNRKEIVETLRALDPTLDVEQRMLPLGDMIWIAKKHLSAGGRIGVDEVVLDCVVERKRLDDLCISIRDGRYLSQKARMKDSAISDRVYLIEKYDASAHYATWGKMIWTAKSQLQVNDGFHLFEALNLSDTCNYLKNKTSIIKEMHQGAPIHVIPDRVIDRQDYLALQRHLRIEWPERRYLTTYEMYAELNSAEAGRTLRAQWGAMLMRIKGITAEKATQLVERWPTPQAFWEDVDRERRARERLGETITNKKMGDWIGEEVCREGTEAVRALKGVVAGRVWALFAQRGKYEE